MKQMDPNRLFNQPCNVLLPGKTQILMMKKLLFLLVFALYCANISAQGSSPAEPAPAVREIKSFLSTLTTADLNSLSTYSRAQHIQDLIQKVQPSVYFNSGVVKTYGDKPKALFTDIHSLNGISNASILKNNIEIVTIKINTLSDLNSFIDLSVFSTFKKLKYVYILSAVKVSEPKINSMVTNHQERLGVFYQIDRSDSNQ